MADFDTDFRWQAEYVPLARDIIDNLPRKLWGPARDTPRWVDIKYNADLMLIPVGGQWIAMRLRRPYRGYVQSYGLEFTIRSERSTGAETELSKIRRGLGDWLFYGHIERGWGP